MNIQLADIKIPMLDYAVGAACVLGIRDSGKTVTCKGLAEQLIEAKIPIVVFDAVGKWRFMKAAGKDGRGYKVVVIGGREPDLPLTPDTIAEVVRAALRERIPIIVDLFDPKLSKADWKRIVKTAIKIIHYENDGSPIHVFLEEAAEFVPQRIIDMDVYAEIEKLARMGGNNGVGITLINQRSQELNKAVLEQCTTLILGNQIGNKAIEAVSKWVERLDKDTVEDVLEHLPRLRAGEAYVWTRQNQDKPMRQSFPMCKSYHPDRRTQTAHIKDVGKVSDTREFIAKMNEAIPKVIEQAKANDPEQLRKEIHQLKSDIRRLTGAVTVKEVEVRIVTPADIKLMEKTIEQFHQATEAITSMRSELVSMRDRLLSHAKSVPNPNYKPAPFKVQTYGNVKIDPPPKDFENKLNRAESKILHVIGTYPGASKSKIAILAGYAKGGGGFLNALSKLKTAACISVENDCYQLTSLGEQLCGPIIPPPTGQALFDMWTAQLNHCECEILRVLWETKDTRHAMSKEDIAALTVSKITNEPYEPKGGGFLNALSGLRTRDLIVGSDSIRLAESFTE